MASIFRPRQDPIKGFQSYAPLEEDLPQWHKVRLHVLPGDEDRDYTNVQWDVSAYILAFVTNSDWPLILPMASTQHVRLPFLKDYEIVEQDKRQAGATDQIIVLSFCDGEQMAQQDEIAGTSSGSVGNASGSANGDKTSKIEEDDEDDDDDLFGDKEEEVEAKKEEVEDMSTRVKAKGKGVYFVEMFSTVNVKRMRTVVSISCRTAGHIDC